MKDERATTPATLGWALAGIACAAMVGCAVTQRAKVKQPGTCVFLRPVVCAKLQPGGKGQVTCATSAPMPSGGSTTR